MNWKLFSVIMILQVFSAFAMFTYIPLLTPIAYEFNLNAKQVGFIATTGALGGTFLGIVSGWLVDQLKTNISIMLGPGLIFLSLLIFSSAQNYLTILIANLFIGLGYGIVLPLTSRLIAYYFSKKYMGILLSFRQSGSTIGQAMGGLILPSIILAFSWRVSLQFVTGIMFIIFLISFFYFFSKNTNDINKKQNNKYRKDHSNKNKIRQKIPKNAFYVLLTGFTMFGYQASFSAFLIPFLSESKELNFTIAGFLLAVAQISGAISRPVLGWASDVLFRGSRKIILLICGFGNVIATICLVFLTEKSLFLTVSLLLILGFTCFGWAGIYFTYLVEIFGVQNSGLSTGYGMMANSLGAAVSPFIFGLLIDLTSYEISFIGNTVFILAITLLVYFKLTEVKQKDLYVELK